MILIRETARPNILPGITLQDNLQTVTQKYVFLPFNFMKAINTVEHLWLFLTTLVCLDQLHLAS
jgi:hypothetical protein